MTRRIYSWTDSKATMNPYFLTTTHYFPTSIDEIYYRASKAITMTRKFFNNESINVLQGK
jgi:hypothetical protein